MQSESTLTVVKIIANSTSDLNSIDLQVKVGDAEANAKPKKVTLADIIGEFGFYQWSIMILTFLRYVAIAMMTNTGPLIAPEVEFWCQVPETVMQKLKRPENTTVNDYLKGKCLVELNDGWTLPCESWSYNTTEYGVTLTDSFDLVCENDFYRSVFQSSVSIGVVVASIIWGSFSDVNGRIYTVRVCFVISLIAGLVSYLAKSYLVYTVSRAICSLSDLGLVGSLATIIVETVGNKYRGPVCIIVYTGWSVGVMIMPWLTEYFQDYRQLMLFTVIYHLFTLPWILTVQESIRWSMVNGKIENARAELVRISKWNGNGNTNYLCELESKFVFYKEKFVTSLESRKALEAGDNELAGGVCKSILGGFSKVRQLLQTKEMAIATMTMIWLTFTSELLYMLFTLINSDIGDDVKLNYAIGGIMEGLATLISIVVISRVTRKLSLAATLTSIALLSLTLGFCHHLPTASVIILNANKLAISTLSSLVYVATTEIFCTNLRQTGAGLCGTLGSLGAVVAPFIRTELTNMIGITNVMIIVCLFPLAAALVIPFFLRETKGIELADEIEDFE